MALFERGDERDQLIVCSICKVKCAERSITLHRYKCSNRPDQKFKFEKGLLERCTYDTNHIVEKGKMKYHLEFCGKRQSQLVAEFQEAFAYGNITTSEDDTSQREQQELGDSSWGLEANSESLVTKMGQLDLQ